MLVLIGSTAPLVATEASAQSAVGDPIGEGSVVVDEVIPKNDVDWWYNDSLLDLGTTWRGLDYTYGPGWKNAQARFGNDGCCNTLLDVDPYENAVYLRKEFTVDNVSEITAMAVSFQYDDAAILWLNGNEVYRTIRGNLPESGEVPFDYDVMTGGAEDLYVEIPGDNYVEQHPVLGRDLTISVPPIDAANLREGKNVFAVMLFNRRGSLDTSTDLALKLTRTLAPVPTPSPQATATPLPTAPPQPTATPEPTVPPQPTAIPQPTATPGPTATPDLDDPPHRLGFTTVVANAACLPQSGRVDVSITNSSESPTTYIVMVGDVSRSKAVEAGTSGKVSITGRSDGPYMVSVIEAGTRIFEQTVMVDCAPDIEVAVETSCLASNGRLDFYLKNTTIGAATYSVEVANLSPRRRTIIPGQQRRVTITGRPDGDLPFVVKRDDVTIKSGTLSVDCDPNIPALIRSSCLSGNGRIDALLANLGAEPNRYSVSITGLAPRTKMVQPGATSRVAVTGRPDGDYTVTVAENATTILDEVVTINCDR